MASQQDKGRDEGAKKRSGGSKSEFNRASGSEDETPRMTKAQLLSMLQSRLPKAGTGNEYVTQEKERMVPTDKQKKLMRDVENKDITIINGPFGTGKTIWTCYMALKGLAEGKYNGVVINAPAVEADEKLGFLPGNQDEKMYPHVLQLLESFDDWVGEDLRQNMVRMGLIRIEPHAFMRGRTFKKKLCIFDECQNATAKNLGTAISRLGAGSAMVFMGDDDQNDRTNSRSAFMAMIDLYANNPDYSGEIGYVKFDSKDCRRHPLLQKMIERGDVQKLKDLASAQAQPQKLAGERQPSATRPPVPATNALTPS
ncbi:MAG: PhoH family protein [Micavibrio aeruginosavorus]|uniref:PhoH-like protein n=1 Tax=Micavibrio aeruginosavorus TaxID=349221 RepID=A0A7T5R1G6_9BACT|nr:MAG: PhoH family protein [Micavibrio aeruginosavorus]